MEIAVVGSGASGMMAAIMAARTGALVTVFERNTRAGIKLNITGKGRCNITNNCDNQTLIKNIPGNGRFLFSAFSAFSAEDTMDFFEEIGVKLKTERGNRVFPVSDSAKEVTAALTNEMKRLGVKTICDTVTGLEVTDGSVKAVYGKEKRYPFGRVILASGGRSYPRTGSDGLGYKILSEVGHTVTNTRPSLVPLNAEGDIPIQLEGLSLKNIAVTLVRNNKEIYNDFGEMVFTHTGVSGPVILSASPHVARESLFPCTLKIDLKPALDEQTLDKRILRDFEENLNRDFSNSLGKLLPSKLIPVIVELSGIAPDKKVNAVTREERIALVRLIKGFALNITGTGSFSEAVITAGGVSVKEINPKTMESKLVHNLYICGEVIDVDAYTGGFNLQIAWSTGAAAGKSAALGG